MKKNPFKNKKILLVLGLGNPGQQYNETRHNAGFHVVEYLADLLNLNFKKPFLRNYLFCSAEINSWVLVLVKPLTYMNRSGIILQELSKRFPFHDGKLLVICDNMDLKPGEIRIKNGGSSAGHNGIKSILEHAGTEDFLRIYIGVGRPSSGDRVVQHVLEKPESDERTLIVLAEQRAAQAVPEILEKPFSRIMNEYNRKQS